MTIRREDIEHLDLRGVVTGERLPLVHPGEVLLEDFLKPMGISQYALAKAVQVPPRRINEIVHAKRSVTADTALRLARFFGMSEGFWIGLQAEYDLEVTRRALGTRLDREVVPRQSPGPDQDQGGQTRSSGTR